MPNYGFAIDLRKCIGCHACTIACKAEHQIPVGVNRCWVKTVEQGVFPETRRFFFPVLCNQCDNAPCARICPTGALFRRRDGIVDLHGEACIGCRACMVACPYDQLFIDPNTRTAEKCNFCANRIENHLAPACVSVCPTECRIFGDLDDPASEVARIARDAAAAVRKPEKGTRPKVIYLAAAESVIRPEIAARPFMFKEGRVTMRPLGSPDPDPDRPGDPRVDYDAPHHTPWGLDMAVYLLTKGVGTGAMLLSALLWLAGVRTPLTRYVGPAIAAAFTALTAAVLVFDLERPERFYYILVRPNRRSWMTWGAYFLTVHGMVAATWVVGGWLGNGALLSLLAVPAIVASLLATAYTGFLFAQGLARDLWQGHQATFDLVVQAILEGAAVLLIAVALSPGIAAGSRVAAWLVLTLGIALVLHLLLLAAEHVTPNPTRHRALATRTIRRGPLRIVFWGGAILAGGVVPLAVIAGAVAAGAMPASGPVVLVALLAVGGSFAWEYVWVAAGQAVPLS
jgi:Fe-S-cluster-containing dehydrogenase component/formate-dependent nitrite reductase membrane component NrfD